MCCDEYGVSLLLFTRTYPDQHRALIVPCVGTTCGGGGGGSGWWVVLVVADRWRSSCRVTGWLGFDILWELTPGNWYRCYVWVSQSVGVRTLVTSSGGSLVGWFYWPFSNSSVKYSRIKLRCDVSRTYWERCHRETFLVTFSSFRQMCQMSWRVRYWEWYHFTALWDRCGVQWVDVGCNKIVFGT